MVHGRKGVSLKLPNVGQLGIDEFQNKQEKWCQPRQRGKSYSENKVRALACHGNDRPPGFTFRNYVAP